MNDIAFLARCHAFQQRTGKVPERAAELWREFLQRQLENAGYTVASSAAGTAIYRQHIHHREDIYSNNNKEALIEAAEKLLVK